jgi:DNA-binding transcriptional ArsR family regulator
MDHPLDALFGALADPTRRGMLRRLARGPATVKELAAPFDLSGPAICRHLRVLERAGLVRVGRDAQRRPRTLEAGPLRLAAAWLADFPEAGRGDPAPAPPEDPHDPIE